MIEIVLCIIGAFVLYAVLLPLIGAFIGVAIHAGFPYLMGIVIASIIHKVFHGSYVNLELFWIFALAWSVILFQVRKFYKKSLELDYSWHEGHFQAAKIILFMGLPYRKAKRATVS